MERADDAGVNRPGVLASRPERKERIKQGNGCSKEKASNGRGKSMDKRLIRGS